jgi:hypothetical protein
VRDGFVEAMSASPLGVTLLAALESRASVPVHHALSSETSPASVAAAVDAVGQLSIGETGTSSRADDGIEPALSAREIVSRPVVVPQQSRAATVEDICRSLAPPMAGVSQKGQELEPEIRTAQPVPIPNERVMSSGKSNNRHGSYRHADNGLVTLVPKARTKAKASTPSSSGPNAGSAGAWNLPSVGHLLVPIDGQLTTARDQLPCCELRTGTSVSRRVAPDRVPVGELAPLRRHRFVTADAAIAMFRSAPHVDADRFRADLDAIADQDPNPHA